VRLVRDNQGYTLLELTVSMAIFFIVLFALYSMYEAGQFAYARAATDADLREHGRRAMEQILKQVRVSGYDPLARGIFGFKAATGFNPQATESRLLFSTDANRNGILDQTTDERIGFALFGSELRRTMDGMTPVEGIPPLARNVESLRITYFDLAGKPIPAYPGETYSLGIGEMARIRRVSVALRLSNGSPGKASRARTITEQAWLRNP
jgi:type II secretory pathway component PulJ